VYKIIKIKTLLINPPDLNFAKLSTGWNLEIDSIGMFPPYGLISLAAYIQKHSKHEIKVLDCKAEGNNFEFLESRIKEYQPDVIGITAFTYTFFDVLKSCKLIRQALPKAHICIGGPNVILFPEETILHKEIDSVIIGDGEIPFLNLLDNLSKSEPLDNIEYVLTKNNVSSKNGVFDTAYIKDLDSLPFPAYGLIKGDLYKGTFGTEKKMVNICSSRGCPYQCTFCQVLVKKYRSHSVGYMTEMIKQYYSQGYTEFYFFDDLFNISTQRVIDISNAILSNNLKINWIFRGRADKINEEMIRLARKSGCSQIILGVEDYTDEGLKTIKKGVTIEQVKKSIKLAHKYGIEVSTNWIIGLPAHKTPDDIKKLVEISIKIGSDYAQYGILQLLPKCEMFDEAVKDGIIHGNSWKDFVKNPVPNYQIEPYNKYISLDELSVLYKYCHTRFYRRIPYILKRLIKLKNFGQLKRMIKPAIRILFK